MFENAAGCVYHQEAGYLHLAWSRKQARDADVKALYEATAQALGQYKCTRILSDHRHMPPVSPAVQRWLADVWVPGTVRDYGYNRGAVIQAFNVFNRLATNQIVTQIAHVPLAVSNFDNEHEAARWLLEE
ncbi:hypothetical protein B0919_06880 [Hymenobacter sp. CRA2]|nr:hypothetical protein B0919_06880 [Hymenobacter sp. CRA2]